MLLKNECLNQKPIEMQTQIKQTLWDNVKVRNGKLVGGILTDKLALQAYPSNNGSVVEPNHTGFKVVKDMSSSKVNKRMPSKFR
jgi:hypothetical protein